MNPASIMLALALAAAAPAASSWQQLSPGLEFRTMDGGGTCRKGSARIAVVRAEPDLWRVDLFHVSEQGEGATGVPVDLWQERTGAAVVANGSQYYPGRVPMGLFIKNGRNLGTKRIQAWKGLLLAEPNDPNRPRATILDLEHDTFDLETTPYAIVLQSFMILDRFGKKRVRRSDWHANRTVLATDRGGRLLILYTEGAYTLWELADWIDRSDLDVVNAMSLDGGFESQLCVREGAVDYVSHGHWHVDDRGDHSLPGVRARPPSVIGLLPRSD